MSRIHSYFAIIIGTVLLSAKCLGGEFPEFITDFSADDIENCFSNNLAIRNSQFTLPPHHQEAFRQEDRWYSKSACKSRGFPTTNSVAASPLGSKSFRIFMWNTKASKETDLYPPIARFIVDKDTDQGKSQAIYQFDFGGHDIGAEWIDEHVIKIVYWPSMRVRALVLIDVDAGKVVYKSMSGEYNNVPSAK